MAEINEYFPNVKIRTLKSDLESLKQSGGSFIQQKEIKIERENFLFKAQKQESVIAPPALEIRSVASPSGIEALTPQQQKVGSIKQSIQNRPDNPADIKETDSQDAVNPKLLWGLGGGLILIIGLSIGFWLIYPNINKPLANLPTPSPAKTESPSPSPSPEAPILALKTPLEKFPIILNSLDVEELTQKLRSNVLMPQPIGTLISFEPKLGVGEYLSGENLIKILSPNSLSSLKSTIGKEYLLLGYWETGNKPNLSLVFTIKQESLETAKSIVRSWETANMEEYFPVIFLPQPPEKRKTETFRGVKISNVDARMIIINQQKFIYTIVADKLIISSSEKAFEIIVKNI